LFVPSTVSEDGRQQEALTQNKYIHQDGV